MKKLIASVRSYKLFKNKNNYFFVNEGDLKSVWGIPVNQYGTKKEVLETLKIWRDKVDIPRNNTKMIEMENCFIKILESA